MRTATRILFAALFGLGAFVTGLPSAQATDMITLTNQVKELERQLNACRNEVNSLKATITRMKERPSALDTAPKPSAEKPKASETVQDEEAAKRDVCHAVDEYAAKIRRYAKISDPDDRWDKMRSAYTDLEKVLNKYGTHEILEKIRKLTSAIKFDVHEGIRASFTSSGNAGFERAIKQHVKKLNDLRKLCDE